MSRICKTMIPMVVLTIALGGYVTAAEKSDPAAEQAAIRKAIESYVAAFNKGDAKAVAGHWAVDGEYVNPAGDSFKGREAIQKEFEAFFKEVKGLRVEVSNPVVRLVKPGVATEEGTARVTRPDGSVSETTYVATHVKQDGKWKVTSIREATPGPVSHYEHLKDLEWMVGEWVDEDKSSKIETVCGWTKNKNFLTRSFKVSIEGRAEIEGTQVIGWDPIGKQIHSWIFDSDGGFGEGIWTRKEDRWIIKASRVLAGGERGSAVNIFTPVDDNSFTWKSVGREVDGQLMPSIPEVTVVRKQSNK